MKYFLVIIIIIALLAVIAIIFFIKFCYGPPNSKLVNIVGKNLKNFIEYEKTGTASLENLDYTIVFFKNTFVEKDREPFGKGDYLYSYLIIRTLSNESGEFIIDEGNYNDEIIIDEKNNRLFYISKDFDKHNCHFNIFNYKAYQNEGRILITNNSTLIHRMVYDNINENVLFYGFDGKNNFYLKLDLNTKDIIGITEGQYEEESKNFPRHINTSYVSGQKNLELFTIIPNSDFLPANYKHKFTGIYINDGKNNIRILKNGFYITTPVYWLMDGKFVIFNKYLIDTSGKINEAIIADGPVRALF
ncbi:MAG: oligogalacturonate lyase family protein [Treponema sp.]|nr:oligogalacturonate lyase family protein [Treponema sp.]